MNPQPPPQEPTVLDYVKALLTPWKREIPMLPSAPREQGSPPVEIIANKDEIALDEATTYETPINTLRVAVPPSPIIQPAPSVPVESASEKHELPAERLELASEKSELPAGPSSFPWLSVIVLGLALLAQLSLEPSAEIANRSWMTGVVLYGLAVALLWSSSFLKEDWRLVDLRPTEQKVDPLTVNWIPLAIGAVASVGAYATLSDNRFTSINVTLWGIAVGMVAWGFWLPNQEKGRSLWTILWRGLGRAYRVITSPQWVLKISRVGLLVLLGLGVVLYFRVYDLPNLPAEMISDHREKLQDVSDILNGQYSIFFPRNTGREALQMYMTAAIATWLGTGLSHMSLKIGTVLAGLLTLPYIYLLGKEIGGRRAGLLAAFLAGIAYWPNVISRFGLRFPLYPWFVAPTLFYLLRGLRSSNRNDFILAGLALGIGLHGYTPIRILPLVVVAAVGLFLLHKQSAGRRMQAIWGLATLTVVSVIVFLPLLRFITDTEHPEYSEIFFYRSFTRAFDTEQELPAPAGQVFMSNLWRAVTMFAWDDGETWVHSVTHRPALDIVSAALFYLGCALLFLRYLRKWHWQDLFLILSVPLLMLPSILSLAFPNENPALNRTAGAIVPVFVIVGLAFDGILTALQRGLKGRRGMVFASGLALVLLTWSAAQNYDLVFRQYRQSFDGGSWNAFEMGQVIREYAQTGGSLQSAWVVPFPYWVDTIVVGIQAGDLRDFAIQRENIASTMSMPGSKLFLFYTEDVETRQVLQQIYPQGMLSQYPSRYKKDFMIYLVPGSTLAPTLAPAYGLQAPLNQEMP